jgi:hypothetical protein
VESAEGYENKMIDVYVTEMHPWYQVWVNGEIVSTFSSTIRLTSSEMYDISAGFREAYDE